MFKDENGICHSYYGKAANAIAFLYESDNEEHKKKFNIAINVMMNMEKIITDCKILLEEKEKEIAYLKGI